jgi:hypothetical protein
MLAVEPGYLFPDEGKINLSAMRLGKQGIAAVGGCSTPEKSATPLHFRLC